ncbi:MAG: J domain-containing protein [Spirochaetes bacterium]|jgi:curved DNA-binding protein CbpA|nr:J domain-containing protein [Spirochaetota bacterium]
MDKKTENYLRIFGLSPGYSMDELVNAYRTLAKLNHPDVNHSSAASMRMVLLNEGYTHLQNHVGSFPDDGGIDPVYSLYREGVDIMSSAFDAYYGGNEDQDLLKVALVRAKECFSIVVKEYPASDWINDSIDKICSINKWL